MSINLIPKAGKDYIGKENDKASLIIMTIDARTLTKIGAN